MGGCGYLFIDRSFLLLLLKDGMTKAWGMVDGGIGRVLRVYVTMVWYDTVGPADVERRREMSRCEMGNRAKGFEGRGQGKPGL